MSFMTLPKPLSEWTGFILSWCYPNWELMKRLILSSCLSLFLQLFQVSAVDENYGWWLEIMTQLNCGHLCGVTKWWSANFYFSFRKEINCRYYNLMPCWHKRAVSSRFLGLVTWSIIRNSFNLWFLFYVFPLKIDWSLQIGLQGIRGCLFREVSRPVATSPNAVVFSFVFLIEW